MASKSCKFDGVKLSVEAGVLSPSSDPGYPSDVPTALLNAARAELVERGVDALSLRAIADRAGVSRATPKWHFGDRAGLLTAVAAEGFRQFGQAQREAIAKAGAGPSDQLAALGRAYLQFGIDHPALFDLMFRPHQLRVDDAALRAAKAESFSVLEHVAAAAQGRALNRGSAAGQQALLAWALVHGLVVLLRNGALQDATGIHSGREATELAQSLVDAYTRRTP